jgi:hypothetical protein
MREGQTHTYRDRHIGGGGGGGGERESASGEGREREREFMRRWAKDRDIAKKGGWEREK